MAAVWIATRALKRGRAFQRTGEVAVECLSGKALQAECVAVVEGVSQGKTYRFGLNLDKGDS